MPKNTQGGSKHKSGRNSESSTVRKNKKFFDKLLSDIRESEDLTGVHIARVTAKCGDGRMEVLYYTDGIGRTMNAPVAGALRGRGKKDAFVDIGTIVVLCDNGMSSGTTHVITAVLSRPQVSVLRKEMPELDARLFLVPDNTAGGAADTEDVFEDAAPSSHGDTTDDSEIDVDKV